MGTEGGKVSPGMVDGKSHRRTRSDGMVGTSVMTAMGEGSSVASPLPTRHSRRLSNVTITNPSTQAGPSKLPTTTRRSNRKPELTTNPKLSRQDPHPPPLNGTHIHTSARKDKGREPAHKLPEKRVLPARIRRAAGGGADGIRDLEEMIVDWLERWGGCTFIALCRDSKEAVLGLD